MTKMKTLITGIVALGALAATAANQTIKQSNNQILSSIRWMLEEYRVSLFAQELHTPEPVSPKRLDAKWAEIST